MGGVTMTGKRGRGGPSRGHEPRRYGPEGTSHHPPSLSSHRQPCFAGLMSRSARGGKNAKKRAAVAVARKLAVLLHRLWVRAEVYDPLYNTHRRQEEEEEAA